MPPTPLTPGNITFNDPLDDAMAQMNAPRQLHESNETYEQRRNAALRHTQQRTVEPEPQTKTEPTDNDLDSFTTCSQARGTNEPHTPARMGPFHVPMNDDLQTRIVFQKLRNEDLASWGKSPYDNQGIVFQNQQPVDLMKEQYLQSTGQAPAPEEPDGDNDGDDRRDHHNPQHPDRTSRGSGHGGLPGDPGGDGGPPGGGNGPPSNDDEGFPHNRSSIPHRGYTMPPAGCTRLRSPGVQAVLEHHCSQMHLRLVRLCRQ